MSPTPPPPLTPLFLLSDEPIGGHADDFLSRDDDARTIAEAVLGTTGPFSVGIYGDWGTGKTSLLHHVKSLLEEKQSETDPRLRHPHIVTVIFNAWQYEKDDQPLAHLAEAVDAAITKRLKEVQSVGGVLSERAIGWLRSAHLAARSLAYGASVESRFDPTDELVKARRWQFWKWAPIFKFSAKDAIDRFEKLQKETADPNSRAWKSHVDQSVTRSVLRSFRADHTLLDKVRPGEEKRIPRVVVFIDDMDRCLPEDAFALLQSIKLALAQPGFIFVMTLDPAALQPIIDKKTREAGQNTSDASKAIYLDKLVQVQYPLRLHDDQFEGFVTKVVQVRLKEMLVAPKQMAIAEADTSIAPLWQAFRDLAKVLEVSSQKNPRTLIRRINALLVDARLAPQSTKDRLMDDSSGRVALAFSQAKQGSTNTEHDPLLAPARARAEAAFIGLCLIRHTLRQFVGIPETNKLSAAEPLCKLIKERGLDACIARLQAVTIGRFSEERATSVAPGADASNEPGDTEFMQNKELLQALKYWPRLDALFRTDAGQRWLGFKEERDLVDTFYAKRPDETKSNSGHTRIPAPDTMSTATTPDSKRRVGDTARAGVTPPTPTGPAKIPTSRGLADLSDEDRTIFAQAIRGSLDLPANAPLFPAAFARVTQLDFTGDPITDAGVAWIAAKNSPLTALTSLNLSGTKVTDAGVAALAQRESTLTALTSLDLSGTVVTDEGVKALAAKDSAVTSLTSLILSSTKVTDEGVKALAAKDSAVNALTSLDLSGTKITDDGVRVLAAKNSVLTSLSSLVLFNTGITDAGVRAIAAKESPLASLTRLGLYGTKVTDEGVKALAASDTVLTSLTSLVLYGANITDASVKALAFRNSPLTALRELYLRGTEVTDEGVKALAAKDSALTALTSLNLFGTHVTDDGVKALAAKDSALVALSALDLRNTQITDDGVKAIASNDSALITLSSLHLRRTKVTNDGVKALEKARPMLKVFR